MTHCDHIHQVSAYHDGELPSSVCAELKAHLETCEPCRRHLQALRAISHRLIQAPLPQPTEQSIQRWKASSRRIQENRLRRFVGWMTSAAAGVLVVSSLWNVPDLGPTEASSTLSGIDSAMFHAEYSDPVPTTVLAAQWMATDLSLEGGVW